MTQITELKLLLDIGRQGHSFYDFVLTLLIACISLEIFVGIIIIYIGNLRYTQDTEKSGLCQDLMRCLFCCCRACNRWSNKRNGNYLSVRAAGGASDTAALTAGRPRDDDDAGCCDWLMTPSRLETIIDLERADSNIEAARVRVADADVRIVRSTNYVKVVEDALKKTPGNQDLEEELAKAKDELHSSVR